MKTISITQLPRMEQYKVRRHWKSGHPVVYAQERGPGHWALCRSQISEELLKRMAADGWAKVEKE